MRSSGTRKPSPYQTGSTSGLGESVSESGYGSSVSGVEMAGSDSGVTAFSGVVLSLQAAVRVRIEILIMTRIFFMAFPLGIHYL